MLGQMEQATIFMSLRAFHQEFLEREKVHEYSYFWSERNVGKFFSGNLSTPNDIETKFR